MKNRLGVGIVGYGKVASGGHRRWVDSRPETEVVAVCDTTEVRRSAASEDNPEATIYDRYEDFLSDSRLDLVIVTTPPSSHCELAVKACEAGKHIFVDKPFAMNKAEADRMLAAGAKAGVVVHCHQSRRYDGEFRRILKEVKAGKIGDVVHVRRVWTQYGDGWANWGIEGFNPSWRIQREYGGGMVYDYAPHCGDQILQLVNQPLQQVYADVRGIKFSDEVDDHFLCTLRFEGGATAYLEASNMERLPAPHWYVVGTKGCISAESVNSSVTLLADGMDEAKNLEPISEIADLYDNLVAACTDGVTPVVTPEELKVFMGLIDAIFRSAKNGEKVDLQ